MYQIDLLNNKGVPTRNKPEVVFIATITILVPLMVGIVMFGFYMDKQVEINIIRNQLKRCEQKIASEKLSEAVKEEEKNKKYKKKLIDCYSGLSTALSRHFQWTDQIKELVNILPRTMVLTDLKINKEYIKKKKADPEKPDRKIEYTVPRRTIKLSLRGYHNNDCDRRVRDFKKKLESSDMFADKISDVIVSQEVEEIEIRKYAIYSISCILKDGI